VATTTGQYFYKSLPTTPSAPARDDRSALLLWQRSAALAGLKEKVRRRFDTEDQSNDRVLIFSRTPISPGSSSMK
jgi:hypothetical protein